MVTIAAKMVMVGVKAVDTECKKAAFWSLWRSCCLNSSTRVWKGFSQAYIFMNLIEPIISFIRVTRLSVIETTLVRSKVVSDDKPPWKI